MTERKICLKNTLMEAMLVGRDGASFGIASHYAQEMLKNIEIVSETVSFRTIIANYRNFIIAGASRI
jgi:hypothetical protein